MYLIVLKVLLILIQILAGLSLLLMLIIFLGVRFFGWELNIKYEKDKE